MNILIQYEPRSIALRGAGTNPYALIFRHASREEDSGNRCIVEFLPWKDVNERNGYKSLSSVEVYGSLGLIDIEKGMTREQTTADYKTSLFVLLLGDVELRLFDRERRSIVSMLLNSIP